MVPFDKSLQMDSQCFQDMSIHAPSSYFVPEEPNIRSFFSAEFIPCAALIFRMSREMWEFAKDGQLNFEKVSFIRVFPLMFSGN